MRPFDTYKSKSKLECHTAVHTVAAPRAVPAVGRAHVKADAAARAAATAEPRTGPGPPVALGVAVEPRVDHATFATAAAAPTTAAPRPCSRGTVQATATVTTASAGLSLRAAFLSAAGDGRARGEAAVEAWAAREGRQARGLGTCVAAHAQAKQRTRTHQHQQQHHSSSRSKVSFNEAGEAQRCIASAHVTRRTPTG